MTLIAATDLHAWLGDPRLRLVDCRWYLGRPGDGRIAYESGHLPGAIHLDLDGELAAAEGPGRHPLPSPAAFAATLGAAGIGEESFVVAYDDVGGWVAARLWWMLERIGHRETAVLDGGVGAWVASGGSLEAGAVTLSPRDPHPLTGEAAEGRWPGTIDRDRLRARLGELVVLDARAPERYRGEVEPIDPVAGHIPTALNAPVAGNLAADGCFLPRADLMERYASLGAASGKPVVVSCGSGVSAIHASLAMRVVGLADPVLYVGSWSDWSTAGYPVATGDEPGDPPARD